MKGFILTKLKEGSTWAGIGILVASATFIPNSVELAALVPAFGTVVAGLLSIYFT